MHRINPPPLDKIRHFFTYTPFTGELRWRVDRPPAVKAGDEAGTVHSRDGFISVVLEGTRYPAHYICWYLQTGEWPRRQLRFRDENKSNLIFSNLGPASARYSLSKQAVYARKRAEERQAERDRQAEKISSAVETRARGIRYSLSKHLWEAFDINNPGTTFRRFATEEDAAVWWARIIEKDRFLITHGYHPKPGDGDILSGSEHTMQTYKDIATALAYNPADGAFYWRHLGATPGEDVQADYDNTSGRRVVSLWGRYFSVGMLAWFLTHREWPRPKSIGFKDGNPANAKLSNLYRIT